jgi:nitroreductase
MEFDEVVRRRRMVRHYDPDRPVPPQVVDKLIRHALRAPSAGFSQGWGFLVLQEPADRELFWSTTAPPAGDLPDGWLTRMSTAPLIIVALSNKSVYLERYAQPDKGWTDRDEARWPVPYWDIDAGFAALLIHLTAVDEGLGALTVGYRAADKRSPSLRRGHRPMDEVVHHGRWTG